MCWEHCQTGFIQKEFHRSCFEFERRCTWFTNYCIPCTILHPMDQPTNRCPVKPVDHTVFVINYYPSKSHVLQWSFDAQLMMSTVVNLYIKNVTPLVLTLMILNRCFNLLLIIARNAVHWPVALRSVQRLLDERWRGGGDRQRRSAAVHPQQQTVSARVCVII